MTGCNFFPIKAVLVADSVYTGVVSQLTIFPTENGFHYQEEKIRNYLKQKFIVRAMSMPHL